MGDKADQNNPNVLASKAAAIGLDAQGNLRIGDVFSIGARGDGVEIRSSIEGRTKTIDSAEFESFIKEKWFGEY